MEPQHFICLDCNSDVYSYGDNSGPPRDRCYNCAFIRRVCDTPEQEAEFRKMLGCEWQEREVNGEVENRSE